MHIIISQRSCLFAKCSVKIITTLVESGKRYSVMHVISERYIVRCMLYGNTVAPRLCTYSTAVKCNKLV